MQAPMMAVAVSTTVHIVTFFPVSRFLVSKFHIDSAYGV